MSGLKVSTTELAQLGSNVVGYAQDYNEALSRIETLVNELPTKWSGADSQELISKINGYQPDMKNLVTVLNEYGQFLNQTARSYDQLQGNIRSAASRL